MNVYKGTDLCLSSVSPTEYQLAGTELSYLLDE